MGGIVRLAVALFVFIEAGASQRSQAEFKPGSSISIEAIDEGGKVRVEGLFFQKNPDSGSRQATYKLKGRIVNLTPAHQWPSMVLALEIAAYCTSSYVSGTARLEGSLGSDATEFEYDLGYAFLGDCTFVSVSGNHRSGLSKLTKLKQAEVAELKAKREAEAARLKVQEDERRRELQAEQEKEESERRRAVAEADEAAERVRAQQERLAEAKRRKVDATRLAKAQAERKAFLSKFPLLFNGMPLVFLGSDRKCAQQFIEAAAMEGLEKRKRLAELINFGCGVTVNSQTRVRIIQKDPPYAVVEVIDGQGIGQKGWVPAEWLQSPGPIQIQQH